MLICLNNYHPRPPPCVRPTPLSPMPHCAVGRVDEQAFDRVVVVVVVVLAAVSAASAAVVVVVVVVVSAFILVPVLASVFYAWGLPSFPVLANNDMNIGQGKCPYSYSDLYSYYYSYLYSHSNSWSYPEMEGLRMVHMNRFLNGARTGEGMCFSGTCRPPPPPTPPGKPANMANHDPPFHTGNPIDGGTQPNSPLSWVGFVV